MRTWVAVAAATWSQGATVAPEPQALPVPPATWGVPTPAPAPDALGHLAAADARLLAEVALGEDKLAPLGVMHVILNRARETGRPVAQVAMAPRQFHGWPRPASWYRQPGQAQALEKATALAAKVLAGGTKDPTRGATYFHRVGSWTPTWAPAPRTWRQVGRHHFYRASTNTP